MTLATYISNFAAATPATPATHNINYPTTVAKAAGVAVAKFINSDRFKQRGADKKLDRLV